MNSLIKRESYELSFQDIKQLLPNVKIVKYPDLSKYNDITQILSNSIDGMILYFETVSKNVGHYQCIMRNDKIFTFFDSYGLMPSKDKSYIEKTTLIKLNEFAPYLPDLINSSLDKGFMWLCNSYDYQAWNNNVGTCGRHVCVRLLNRKLTESQYYNYLVSVVKSKGLESFDEAVVFLTYSLIKK